MNFFNNDFQKQSLQCFFLNFFIMKFFNNTICKFLYNQIFNNENAYFFAIKIEFFFPILFFNHKNQKFFNNKIRVVKKIHCKKCIPLKLFKDIDCILNTYTYYVYDVTRLKYTYV